MKATAESVASFLGEYLPGGWEVSTYSDDGLGVHLHMTLSAARLRLLRSSPGEFLREITPNPQLVAEALAQRSRVRFVGPYASRAILRRKVGL